MVVNKEIREKTIEILDNFADKSIKIMSEALAEKDKIIRGLREQMKNCWCQEKRCEKCGEVMKKIKEVSEKGNQLIRWECSNCETKGPIVLLDEYEKNQETPKCWKCRVDIEAGHLCVKCANTETKKPEPVFKSREKKESK